MFKIELLFRRRSELSEIKVPKNIQVKSLGFRSIYEMDGPPMRAKRGLVLEVTAKSKAEVDEWLKDDPEVYSV